MGSVGSGRRFTSFNCLGPESDEFPTGIGAEAALLLLILDEVAVEEELLPWTFSAACVRRSMTASSSGLVS